MRESRTQILADIQQWITNKQAKVLQADQLTASFIATRAAALQEMQRLLDILQRSDENEQRHARRQQIVIDKCQRLRSEIVHIEIIIGE